MKIFIFLGPSLSLTKARQILPNAFYLPPIRCGDILSILRLKPDIIGIIDGYFEKTAAVWHKEILYALEKGVHVVGGSSMGALRASELHTFGMEAIGNIANEYLSGTLNDDDEVAVLHGASQFTYSPLTDAMVNIRNTINKALKEKVIDINTATLIINHAKNLFYQERTLDKAIEIVLNEGTNTTQINTLQNWLINNYFLELKKDDAIQVLKFIADKKFNTNPQRVTVNKPAFFRALRKNTQCHPFSHYESWLPEDEKIALASRYLGPIYRLTRRLAYLLADCYGLAIDKNLLLKKKNMGFDTRMQAINILIAQEEKQTDIHTTPTAYLLMLIKLSGDYVKFKKLGHSVLSSFLDQEPLKFKVMTCFAQYWWLLERHLLRIGLEPIPETLEDHIKNFRLTHKLHTPELTKEWLKHNDLDNDSFQYLLSANARLSIIVMQNNIDFMRDFSHDEDIWWFLDALKLTGVYEEAKNLLLHPEKIKSFQEKARNENPNLEQYARNLDFQSEEDFMSWPPLNDLSMANTIMQ